MLARAVGLRAEEGTEGLLIGDGTELDFLSCGLRYFRISEFRFGLYSVNIRGVPTFDENGNQFSGKKQKLA